MSSFDSAVAFVDSQPSHAVDTATKLELYGFYKTVTTGSTAPTGSRPAFYDLQGRAKWDAWKACPATDADDAMWRYEILAKRLGYGVTEGQAAPASTSAKGNISVSTMAHNEGAEPRSRLHVLAAEGDIEALRAAFSEAEPPDIDQRDDYVRRRLGYLHRTLDQAQGYTLLHAAADRGRIDVVSFLLERGADRQAKDGEGQTPLEAAELAEQAEAVALLS